MTSTNHRHFESRPGDALRFAFGLATLIGVYAGAIWIG